MKLRLTIIAAALAILAGAPAHATGDHTPKPRPAPRPKPTPVAAPAAPTAPAPIVVFAPAPAAAAPAPVQLAAELTPSQVATLRQQADAASQSDAAAKAKAAGGAGGAGGSSGIVDQSTSAARTNVYAMGLPQPIQIAAMAGVACPTPDVSQSSVYGLWGGIAAAQANTSTDACVLMIGYAQYLAACQFWSAKSLLDGHMAKLLPGFKAPTVGTLTDMNAEQCAEHHRPKVPTVAAPTPTPAPSPAPAPAAPPPAKTVSLSADALFDFDKADLKPAGKVQLDALAATLRGEAYNVVLVGHTDAIGSDQYNDRLSMQRANAVRAHLALAGVDLGRMVALGKGKREPVADNATAEGRQRNRRVDVQSVVPQASQRLVRLVAGE